MQFVDHGEMTEEFKSRTRVLFLKGRHKDGIKEERLILKISHSLEKFNYCISELIQLHQMNERIYVSGDPRDVLKASRRFRRLQIDSESNPNPIEFYENFMTRWASCLMKPENSLVRYWMFDCDSEEDNERVLSELDSMNIDVFHSYKTKNGKAIIVRPFNRTKISEQSQRLIIKNPLILWLY